MLVQMQFNPVGQEGESAIVGWVHCARCLKMCDPVTKEELDGLVSGKYGQVLCSECSSSPPLRFVLMGQVDIRQLLKLWESKTVDDLPVSSCFAWTTENLTRVLQLVPVVGWCFWITNDENQWQLYATGLSGKEAAQIRHQVTTVPCKLI